MIARVGEHAKGNMTAVNIVVNVLAMLLPLVLLAVLWMLMLRARKRRGDALVNDGSSTRAVTVLLVLLVVATVVSGTLGGWSLESVLIPLGWLGTGLAIGLLVWLFRR
jgi:hypothetical protein